MLEPARYPTPEEVQAIIARARQLRAQYIAALLGDCARHLGRVFRAPPPRSGVRRRLHPRLA